MSKTDAKMVGEISAHELWRILRGCLYSGSFGDYPEFEDLMQALKLPKNLHGIDGCKVIVFLREWADKLEAEVNDDD